MKFDTLLDKIVKKHNGRHKEAVKELTTAVWDNKTVLKEVVDRFVGTMVSTACQRLATDNRRSAKSAARTGVKTYTPRTGDDRKMILEQQEAARHKWLDGLRYHRLFGGMFLCEATVTDVEASIAGHRRHLDAYTTGYKETIRFELAILSMARKAKKTKIVDVLVPENETRLKALMVAGED